MLKDAFRGGAISTHPTIHELIQSLAQKS